MSNLPERQQQIIAAHADFICKVVENCQHQQSPDELETLLQSAEESGWHNLARAVRKIVAGQRDLNTLHGLDEEDRVIAEAVMRGLQNPATLPDRNARPDPALAAPGLASMILAAARGNVQALTLISSMAEQMSRAGGALARVAAVIRPLINGERDPDILCKGMNSETERLVLDILDDLKKAELN